MLLICSRLLYYVCLILLKPHARHRVYCTRLIVSSYPTTQAQLCVTSYPNSDIVTAYENMTLHIITLLYFVHYNVGIIMNKVGKQITVFQQFDNPANHR